MSITLPHDMALVVEEKIKSGAYASVSEVLREGVRALLERDAAIERWLREKVVGDHPSHHARASNGVPAETIFDCIKPTGSSVAGKSDNRTGGPGS